MKTVHNQSFEDYAIWLLEVEGFDPEFIFDLNEAETLKSMAEDFEENDLPFSEFLEKEIEEYRGTARNEMLWYIGSNVGEEEEVHKRNMDFYLRCVHFLETMRKREETT